MEIVLPEKVIDFIENACENNKVRFEQGIELSVYGFAAYTQFSSTLHKWVKEKNQSVEILNNNEIKIYDLLNHVIEFMNHKYKEMIERDKHENN